MIGGFQVTHTVFDEASKLFDPIANARAYFAAQVSKDEPKVEDQPPARISILSTRERRTT